MEKPSKPRTFVHDLSGQSPILWVITSLLTIVCVFVACSSTHYISSITREVITTTDSHTLETCYQTCRISLVESVPQNLTITKYPIPSTFEAWQFLISTARHKIDVAAYKSSLRGMHVLGSMQQDFSVQGEMIYDELQSAGLNRNVRIRVVENSPSKDRGDNADARSLHEQGAIDRRSLNLQRIYNTGIMHSKFIISDESHFYLGSANLDWRSLNQVGVALREPPIRSVQKLELGVLVRDCPCLARELEKVFGLYWKAATVRDAEEMEELIAHSSPLSFNTHNPLRIQYQGVETNVYIATSPKVEEAPEQTWDLDAIVEEIDNAKTVALIHVMDYFPMFLYAEKHEFWPRIDNSIRAAVLRGVHVKIICAALHYPKIGLNFLKSLEQLNEVPTRGSIDVRIFKVPTPKHMKHLMQRERRTHKKFLVTDTAVVIGTSNWSGDYFEGIGTGVAIVVSQNTTIDRPFVVKMRNVFMRDWDSDYTYSLDHYYDSCISSKVPAEFCETEKDKSLLASSTTTA
ncbi:Phospholipase D3 [Aphelenchoides besseyi]|nr:Phospholipase D3 [Aphelenchoides besseyi]KAI6201379.1 Phospholipase D3 [Aphelenchoides besseyi]